MLTHVEKMKPADELEYTYKKICQNFSNYSAFHLRSKLIPIVYPTSDEKQLFESLKKDFELIKNAVFTEPADQSPWFYHRWLLGRCKKKKHNLAVIVLPNLTTTFPSSFFQRKTIWIFWELFITKDR